MATSDSEDTRIIVARLVSISLEGFFYGILVISLAFVLRSLFFNKNRSSSDYNKVLLVTTFVLAVVATLDFVANIYFVLVTYVLPGRGLSSPTSLDKGSYWSGMILVVCGCVSALVADAALLYRCLVVYDHQWLVIILPGLLWLGNLAASTYFVYASAAGNISEPLRNARFTAPMTSFLALSTATVTVTTSLIAYRIWKATKRTSPFSYANSHGKSLNRTARIVIESGLIVAFIGILLLICYFSSDVAIDTTVNTFTPVVGIAFNLTTIRARRESKQDDIPNRTSGAINSIRLHISTDPISSPVENKGFFLCSQCRSSIDKSTFFYAV